MQEIILESRLNHNSIEELELIDPNGVDVVINKLLNLNGRLNLSHIKALNTFANNLCLIETKRPLNGRKNNKYIVFSKSRESWVCVRHVDGVYHKVKTSKDRSVVERAHEIFCEKHGLSLT